ncbi:hypothetical protein NA56DRAFT_597522 [Hyaloscypha hepaticicola]|uniref:DUF6594 domain-containing protein n=1 Tax=Hyaloscypha hepaticicola TaxID=2082293 RepID=A0A2J6Q967_9HELO|nr:hypothetical protein NA56DRAFT_597522 [Hyaloscypha hepaticicola]
MSIPLSITSSPLKGDATTASPDSYSKGIYNYATNVREPHFLEFQSLHQINIIELQNDLARQNASFTQSGSVSPAEVEHLRVTLKSYVTAIRDYEYVRSLDKMTDPELACGQLITAFPSIDFPRRSSELGFRTLEKHNEISNDGLRHLLKAYLPTSLTWTREEKRMRHNEFMNKQQPGKISPFVDRLARFIIAFVTGAGLVVPMVIMALNRSIVKSLVTMSVATLLFALVISVGVEASNWAVVAATAAYAADLALFIGASGS